MKIVFFGTSSFAARVLTALFASGQRVIAVVTRPDRPQGRNLTLCYPPVKEAFLEIKPEIPIYQPEKASTEVFAEVLRSLQPDLFIVVAYGEIIKENLLSLPRLGCVNIHASLLPKYRGAAPIQRALMDGVKETGITIISMTPEMDAGDVISMASLPVSDEMTYGELEPKLCVLAIQEILKVIEQFKTASLSFFPQDPVLATFAPKIKAEEEKINWNQPAVVIHHQIRALSPKPGAWCVVVIHGEERRIKIKKSFVLPERKGFPGEVLAFNQEGWIVACQTGALSLLEVQLEGKRSLSVSDFIKGMRNQPYQCK